MTDNNQQNQTNRGEIDCNASSNPSNNYRGPSNGETEYKGRNRGGYKNFPRNNETEHKGTNRGGYNRYTRNEETESRGRNRGGYKSFSRNNETEYKGTNRGGYNRYTRNDERGKSRSSYRDTKNYQSEFKGNNRSDYDRDRINNEKEYMGTNRGGYDGGERDDETKNNHMSGNGSSYERGSRNDGKEGQGSNQCSIDNRSKDEVRQYRGKPSRPRGKSFRNNNFGNHQYHNELYEPGKNVNAPSFIPTRELGGRLNSEANFEESAENKSFNVFKAAQGENVEENKLNLPNQLTEKTTMDFVNVSESVNDNVHHDKSKFNDNFKAVRTKVQKCRDDDLPNNLQINIHFEGAAKNVNSNIKTSNSNDNYWHNKTINSNHLVGDDWDVDEDKDAITKQVCSDISDKDMVVTDNEKKNIDSYQPHLEKNNSIDKNNSQGESILNSSSEIDVEEKPGVLESQWNSTQQNYKPKPKLSMQSTNRLSHYNQSTSNYEDKQQRRTIGKMSTEKNEQHTSDDKDFVEYENKFRFKKIEFKIVQEKNGDLFEMPEEYALANCVAEDMNMGSGIAVTFRQKFKGQDELLSQKPKQGGIAFLTTEEGRYIYYLVTKRESNLKPTLETLFKSLKKLKGHMIQNNVKKLAIPRLGCGLDRLEWTDVKKMLEYMFAETDVEIVVCNYEKAAETMQEQNKNHYMRRCKVESSTTPIVEIGEYTIIIYFGTEDGHVSPQIEALDKRFDIIKHYRSGTRKLGEFLFVDKFNYKYPHYGCIVRKTAKDSFDFNALSNCVTTINKINKKYKDDAYTYVAFQKFEDPEDDLIMKKVVNIMRNTFWGITLYVCPK